MDDDELLQVGISFDDIVERTPAGWNYLRKLRNEVNAYTDYEWPQCAYSMQIDVINEGIYALTFSETIEDFLYELKQSLNITGSEVLHDFIKQVENADEAKARNLIRNFEKNIRDINK